MGQIYLLFGKGIKQELIDKIVETRLSTGLPHYVDWGNWTADRRNWTSDHFQEKWIVQLKAVGIKCICHIPTEQFTGGPFAPIPFENIYNMVNHQMNIGPSIDGFFFDCVPNFFKGKDETAAFREAYDNYVALNGYCKRMGKITIGNTGTKNMSLDTLNLMDHICIERDYPRFIQEKQEWVSIFPFKFTGMVDTTNVDTAVSETVKAWQGGVFIFGPHVSLAMDDIKWIDYMKKMQQFTEAPLPEPEEPPEEEEPTPPEPTYLMRFVFIPFMAWYMPKLRILRNSLVRPEVHRKVHPII